MTVPQTDLARRQGRRVFYTWAAQKDAVPFEITGGLGARFRTADGADWLDFGSMTWNANLGHGHEGMTAALGAAAARGLLTYPTSVFPEKVRAAESLLRVSPPALRDGKVFICLSGAEANENAVKMARLYSGRQKIVHRSRSYHGATLGMLSYSGDSRRRPFEPGLPGSVSWKDPYSATPCEGDLEDILRREDPATVAAVMLEGVVGANGVFVPPPGYYRRIRDICDRYDVLFIADEVLSGFGRTGRWFAVDHDDISPDLLTCAKGLTAGYAPGGAVVASHTIANHFHDRVLSCGLTAYAHPLTCAAIEAAIAAYEADDLVRRAARLGVEIGSRLRVLATGRKFVREIRGLGLLWAIELQDNGQAAGPVRMKAVADSLRDRHLHVHKRDNLVFVAPPLVIKEEEVGEGLARLAAALDATWRTA